MELHEKRNEDKGVEERAEETDKISLKKYEMKRTKARVRE